MPTIAEMKASSPAYQALTDQEFADRVYKKHYADKISREEFDKRTAPTSILWETIGSFSKGFNEGFDALVNTPGTLMNLGAEALGYEAPFEPLKIAQQFSTDYEPRTLTGRLSRGIGEVAGGSVIPSAGILKAGSQLAPKVAPAGSALVEGFKDLARTSAKNPRAFAANEAAAITGAGTGVTIAREDDAGPAGELIGGVLGGLTGPAVLSGASRTVGKLSDAAKYSTKMLRRARQPQLAADEDVADAIVKSGATVDEIRSELAPSPSNQLQQRGFTDADLADIISRAARGDKPAAIAKDYGLAESTVRSYLQKHEAMTPTPRNIIDVIKDVKGEGASKPISRLGRAAYGIADDAEASQALMSRQETQGGRVNTIINRAAGGVNYDDQISIIDDLLTNQARQKYALAEQNAQPFNLRPAIRSARDTAFKSAGSIREGMERAINLFFEPTVVGKSLNETQRLRLTELAERIDDLVMKGADEDAIFKAQRRLDAAREDAGARSIRKLGQPISDMKRYQAAREALDDMIAKSFENNKPTRLTRKLTQFRERVNNVVRNANPDLAEADDLYSGAKTTERLLKDGGDLTTRLGSKVENALRGFDKLTPDQKEIYRLGFLKRLANMADNARDGAAVANQFQSEAVRKIVRKLFGPEPVGKKLSQVERSAIRKRNLENRNRAEMLIRDLRQEATTTRTKNDLLSGSRTAEYSSDMNKMLQGAQTAADLATGRWGTILGNLANRLTYQIGESQAKAILRTLIETDPAQLLPILNRLAQQAKTVQVRNAYVAALRDVRSELRRSPSGFVGAATASQNQ